MNSEQLSMADLQAHAKKIRSDAAECLMLSNLATEERRPLFQRIAEHLNSLALEIETETKTRVVEAPAVAAHRDIDPIDCKRAPTDQRPSGSSWRKFTLSLFVALIFIAGVVFWAMSRAEVQPFSFANRPSKTDPSSRDVDAELAALLSDEKVKRKEFGDQLGALIVRLDSLSKELDDLKSFRAEAVAPSSKAPVSHEEGPLTPEAKLPATEDGVTPTGKSGTSPQSSASQQTIPALTLVNPANDQSDQVGTIPPNRIELDPHRLPVGTAGCTHFRSFDPVSGTYTTFDGRRRPCW